MGSSGCQSHQVECYDVLKGQLPVLVLVDQPFVHLGR